MLNQPVNMEKYESIVHVYNVDNFKVATLIQYSLSITVHKIFGTYWTGLNDRKRENYFHWLDQKDKVSC